MELPRRWVRFRRAGRGQYECLLGVVERLRARHDHVGYPQMADLSRADHRQQLQSAGCRRGEHCDDRHGDDQRSSHDRRFRRRRERVFLRAQCHHRCGDLEDAARRTASPFPVEFAAAVQGLHLRGSLLVRGLPAGPREAG